MLFPSQPPKSNAASSRVGVMGICMVSSAFFMVCLMLAPRLGRCKEGDVSVSMPRRMAGDLGQK